MSLLSRIATKLDIKVSQEPAKKEAAVKDVIPAEEKPSIKTQQDNSAYIEANTFKTIMSLLKDGVILLDADNKVVLANQAAEKITGLKFDQMTKQNLDDIISANDETGNTFSISGFCKHPENNPIISLDKKGEEHPLKIELTASITNDKPTGTECILILHDTSPEKMFEQMQIDFVSMASHEFRTPLTSIVNYLAILEEEAKPKMGKEHQDFLDRALSSSKELTALVNNLLNVSKVERGALSVTITPLNWKEKLEEAINNNQEQALNKNITLTLNKPEKDLPQLLADNVRITEVLNNLISNAIAYTKNGGKVDINTEVTDKEVITSVKDTGVGIPQEAMSHLFNKFFRVPGALEEDHSGSGLGLYISKSIIELHKGRIWVESKVGKGSTFYFSLPRADKSQSPTIVNLHP